MRPNSAWSFKPCSTQAPPALPLFRHVRCRVGRGVNLSDWLDAITFFVDAEDSMQVMQEVLSLHFDYKAHCDTLDFPL